jgi:5'-nucleotidase
VRILISNDDGIYADGIWALAHEFKRLGEVIIVAPDREQSAVGTAVSLRKPLRVQQIVPLIQDIPSYSVEGTPSDSVIVGLGKIVTGKIDLVVSGINQGTNLGEDVLISGTVGPLWLPTSGAFPPLLFPVSITAPKCLICEVWPALLLCWQNGCMLRN